MLVTVPSTVPLEIIMSVVDALSTLDASDSSRGHGPKSLAFGDCKTTNCLAFSAIGVSWVKSVLHSLKYGIIYF